MRALLFTLGTILIAAALGAGVGDPTVVPPRAAREWVRTVDGWEPLEVLMAQPRSPRALHPLVVAGVQVFASLGVLVAATPND